MALLQFDTTTGLRTPLRQDPTHNHPKLGGGILANPTYLDGQFQIAGSKMEISLSATLKEWIQIFDLTAKISS